MIGAVLTSPLNATVRLVVDTDVASFIFQWHPAFAPRYVSIIRGAELIASSPGKPECVPLLNVPLPERASSEITAGFAANNGAGLDQCHQKILPRWCVEQLRGWLGATRSPRECSQP